MSFTALSTSATGLQAMTTDLEVIANNLANVNTNGFKSSRTSFNDLLYEERRIPGTENANNDEKPTGLYVGLGVQVTGTQLDFRQGSLIPSERDLDVAIEGDGFFQVQVEDEEAPGGIAYTRAGQFAVNSDGEIVLAFGEGRRLEPNITVPEDATQLQITGDGRVFAQIPGEQEPQEIGQMELAGFINPQGLRQIGENLFAESAASGPPIVDEPGLNGLGNLVQGSIEASNVDAASELIQLIRTQRAYEMNSQAIRSTDETLRSVAQLRA